MLTKAQRDEWVDEHGPWLYWSLPNQRLWPWVLRDGIQPRDITGQAGISPGMSSRPGHIYFMTDCIPAARVAASVVNEPHARVDIRRLELHRFATDEDRLDAGSSLASHTGAVRQLPRWDELTERPMGMQVGDWMNEHTVIVDQCEWVRFSMRWLTVAYRGGVDASILEFLQLYLDLDWEVARPGERYLELPRGATPAHYIGASTTRTM